MSGDSRRGSVKQAANGGWYYVVDVESDELGPDGKPKRKQHKKRGFTSETQALKALRVVLHDLDERMFVAPKRQTLAAFLTQTWLPAIEHTVKPSTFESYDRNVRLHLAGRPIGARQLQDVDGAMLNQLYAQLLTGDEKHRALSSRSVRYISTIAHRAFRDAVKWQAVVRNPVDASDPPMLAARREMTVWSPQQMKAFLDGTADSRYSGAWWLLCTTGMRRGEVLGLRWSDIALDEGRLTVVRTLLAIGGQTKGNPAVSWGTPKTAKGRRQIALDDATVAALRAHRTRQLQERLSMGDGYADDDLVVTMAGGGFVHPKTFSWLFKRNVERLELPMIRLHDTRHSHATHALRAGVHPRIVQERLGHANVSITLDTYSHVDLDMQAAAAAQVAKLLGETP